MNNYLYAFPSWSLGARDVAFEAMSKLKNINNVSL
jgi:hypothetical protein